LVPGNRKAFSKAVEAIQKKEVDGLDREPEERWQEVVRFQMDFEGTPAYSSETQNEMLLVC
jgi:hypothetical protein